MSTHLLIFAPAELHRVAWQALLEKQPGILVAGLVGDLAKLSHFDALESTAVLVDLPTIQADFVDQLHTTVPNYGLLFLVESYDLAEIVDLLRAGATGFISRDASVGDLSRAIIAAGRGEIILPPELATQALVALARGERDTEEPGISLTKREQEVLNLLANGLTNKDIAQSLILSVRTVEAHLHNIYGKLGVASRTEAALWAVNHGYGSPG
jgi:DNA-binding NarL/FixJ family response regulator